MDLMNLALKYKDYEWAGELAKLEEQAEEYEEAVVESVKADIFNEESVALENIANTYAVKEKIGIRAFNINSEYDRNLSELVLVERRFYRKGEKIRYRTPTSEEMIFARGIVNGYVMGYSEANNNLNSQLMAYFNAIEPQASKKQDSIEIDQKKAPKQRKNKAQEQEQ